MSTKEAKEKNVFGGDNYLQIFSMLFMCLSHIFCTFIHSHSFEIHLGFSSLIAIPRS